jgi:4-carboxymuconolactone decarboxylase
LISAVVSVQAKRMLGKQKSKTPAPGKLPGRFVRFQKSHATVYKAYEALGAATAAAGPLNEKTRALVKLAIAVGAQMEGAVHSHTRRAVEAGCSAEEIRHLVLLSTTTMGFPSMMKTLSWVEDIIGNS